MGTGVSDKTSLAIIRREVASQPSASRVLTTVHQSVSVSLGPLVVSTGVACAWLAADYGLLIGRTSGSSSGLIGAVVLSVAILAQGWRVSLRKHDVSCTIAATSPAFGRVTS